LSGRRMRYGTGFGGVRGTDGVLRPCSASRFPLPKWAGCPFLKSTPCRFESDWGHKNSVLPLRGRRMPIMASA
jgi:hypothetical protein